MKRSLAALLLVLACVSPAAAHELGKTQASASVRDGRYAIEITVDPDALLTRLEVFSGAPLTSGLDRAARDGRIAALSATFLDRVAVRFDGRRVTPQFAYHPASAVSDAAQSPSSVRLTGQVPAGARAFSFASALAVGSYALNARIADGPVQTVWLEGPEESAPVSLVAPPAPATAGRVARQYFALGITHIIPRGLDHILFVLGIFLLGTRWRSTLLQVSTFTAAHSITLGLTMYGIVSLPARVVEPLIALSIVYVAVENVLTNELKPWRLALVFSFGLLHGMGFAGVLRDLGLPRSQFLTALLTFNAGVEAGQLTVIALAAAAVAYWRSDHRVYRRFIVQPASALMAIVGMYWAVQRIL